MQNNNCKVCDVLFLACDDTDIYCSPSHMHVGLKKQVAHLTVKVECYEEKIKELETALDKANKLIQKKIWEL